LTDFHTVNTPGIKWTSAPDAATSDPVTVALLSSPDLDARTLSELRWGVQQQRGNATNLTTRDVNADGRDDLVLNGTVAELGLQVGEQILCADGVLPDENSVLSCTPITLAAAPEPTATPTATGAPSPSAGPTTDAPSARTEAGASRKSLAGSGGPNGLVLLGGGLITAVAVSVLIPARRLSAR
jgi:hypothetical protein